ncbi:MAG: UbiA prenyltransferase family protein [Dokdonella sp.]|nr:UbiA prenyltransferase family protein [Dokdonella sp.]MCC6440562.1 UbiA prenyltransferase family protein [Rhodanobacteraceae bacterium]
MPAVKPLLELARPGQWIKNGFVLLPLFFAHALLDAAALRGALLATFAFCLAASAVYAFNDTRDVARDRLHPDKRNRPLARGAISVACALWMSALLAVLAMVVAALANLHVVAVIAIYLASQFAYSISLKHIPFVDVLLVASGFGLRILAGGFGAQVPLTGWILVMAVLLALMLVLGKRHGDLVHDVQGRAALYDRRTVERILLVLAASVLGAYLLYSLSPDVMARHGHAALVYSSPWVVLGIARYLFLVLKRGAGGDPSRLATRDPLMLLASIGWLATLGFILYG